MFRIFYQPVECIQAEYNTKIKSWDMLGQQYHNGYEIYMLSEGERIFYISGKEISVKPGELLIIKPYYTHYSVTKSESITKCILNVSPENLTGLLDESEIQYLFDGIPTCLIRLEAAERKRVAEYFFEICRYSEQVSPVSEKLMKFYIVQFLEYIKELLPKASVVVASQTLVLRPEMQAALKYIHANYSDESFGLDDVIEHVHMSKSRFCELFRSTTGQTFLKYLNMIRIRTVENKLKTTNKSLSRIAEEQGFSSVAHMTRIFKGLFGMSPSEYRRMGE